MPTITTDDGCRLHVEVDGPAGAPALMLCNSLACDLTMWEPQLPAFTQHYRVVRYDRRGHGRSDAPRGPYSYDRLGRDALAVMDGLGLAKVHYCGLSMGGMTAMWLARQRPERLGRMVLANTSAGMPSAPWNDRIRTALANGLAPLVEPTLERWFTPGFRAREPQTIARIGQMILATPPQGYAGCCAAIRDMDQRWGIRAITTPALIIVGAHDPSTTAAVGAALRDAIKGSDLVALEAAHISNIEQPAAFTDAVLRFLAG